MRLFLIFSFNISVIMNLKFKVFIFFILSLNANAQSVYLGADLSYVNEMEDCGVEYSEDGVTKDVYEIFSGYQCNLVRLRLWHTPNWYDELNGGNRYSDLSDVKKSIARAKDQNMDVLLDFHLSDNWADPSKQLVPEAWLSVVDNTSILKDSLYNYIYTTLTDLYEDNLLPEMIQIGNETNKGILLSPSDNQTWTLDWSRNAELFNAALDAVEDFETANTQEVKTVLHVADPANGEWLLDGFVSNGVTRFDIIGLSYYWAWHMPVTIADAGTSIRSLKNQYPGKEVLIVETGYIWTNDFNDGASNIISETNPQYDPVSAIAQKNWLIDLTKEVVKAEGLGVVYWEPAWVSSNCFTQWGQGSHQEHACFFDFENELIIPGGIEFMNYNYGLTSNETVDDPLSNLHILINGFSGELKLKQLDIPLQAYRYNVVDSSGTLIISGRFISAQEIISIAGVSDGIYFISLVDEKGNKKTKKIIIKDQ